MRVPTTKKRGDRIVDQTVHIRPAGWVLASWVVVEVVDTVEAFMSSHRQARLARDWPTLQVHKVRALDGYCSYL